MVMYERHGDTKDGQPRLYRIWRAMRLRCSTPGGDNYPRYGGKGVTVCAEWNESFPAFKSWALAHGYADHLTIDRKENSAGYFPENCRWATPLQQSMNRSIACMVEINGVSKTVKQWSADTGIVFSTLYKRYHRGVRGPDLIKPPTKPLTLEQIRASLPR